jgi:hypothetical protein
MPRRSLTGFLQRAPFLDVQRVNGTVDAYSAAITTQTLTTLYADAALAIPMRLTFSPLVDCWWEVNGHFWAQKNDAAYHYAYGLVSLAPADVDGITGAQSLVEQHSTVQIYETYIMHRIFRLVANTAYTATMQIQSQGGSYSYYRGPNHLWIEGKAWPR